MGARNYNGSAGQGSVNGDVVRSSVVSGTDNYTDWHSNEATRTTGQPEGRKRYDWSKLRLGAPRLDARPDGRR